MSKTSATLTAVEGIKARSNFLRGTLAESLLDRATGAIAADDTHVSKFHGTYQQDDRDVAAERRRQKLEPDYSFMIRVRVPGGTCTPAQWLQMDELARRYANNTLRLTTRQAFQFHGVLKEELKTTIQGINASLLDTLAACGDVNRNVMCTPLTETSAVHARAVHWAQVISDRLTPRTRAYHEIWLDGERMSTPDVEPLYGPTYLPRKFKIAVAIPPHNDVDVHAHDLGFIAIERQGRLVGFNVTAGGGMGATHGDPATYPRLADLLGFCTPAQAPVVAAGIVAVQRDHGDRSERKHARLKYTIADRGLDWLHAELRKHTGFDLLPAAAYRFTSNSDRYGWTSGTDGRQHLTLHVPAGRLRDTKEQSWLSGMRAIAKVHRGEFRLTPNQNLVIAAVSNEQRPLIDALVEQHGLDLWRRLNPLRRDAMACVALPTCGLAMAEAERYLPALIERVAELLERHQLEEEDILVRMTGCPNGCARPYVADIGLIGKAPGRYNLFLGGGAAGQRLNTLDAENLDEAAILAKLEPLFAAFSDGRLPAEAFSDWLRRTTLPEAHDAEQEGPAENDTEENGREQNH